MKNLFITFLILFFLYPQVNAAGVIQYYNDSIPVKNSINTSTGVQFGSNALFTPENRIKAGQRQRQRKYEQQYLESLKNTQNVNVNINSGYPVYYNGYNTYPNILYNSRGNIVYPINQNIVYPNGRSIQTYYGNRVRTINRMF